MRWLFCETDDERAHREAVLARSDAWWADFQKHEAEIRRHIALQSTLDLPAFMSERIGALSPKIAWEFGPGSTDGNQRLAITPEGQLEVAPMVRDIVRRAPKIANWEFVDARPPWPPDWARRTIEARTKASFSGWHVIVSQTSVGHKVQLRYLIPECKRSEDPHFFDLAGAVTEVLLGEQILNDWIGPILVDPMPRKRAFLLFGKTTSVGTPNSVAVEQIESRVRAEIEAIERGLPEQPLFRQEPGGYSVHQREPSPAVDYPGQQDLYVATSSVPGLLEGIGAGAFCSRTFSRAGETFCYVKIDGMAGLAGSRFADRGEIEDALDERLIPAGLGCRVGGGSGLRYSYVELALVDLPKAFEVVRAVLREGGVPRRSWILFHDATLAAEWIGVYPDTPPPPTAETTPKGTPTELRPNQIEASLAHKSPPP